MLSNEDKTLVVGVGNPLRSDDGMGPYVVTLLKKKHLPEIEMLVIQQLNPEVVDYFLGFERIIIVDAGLCKGEVELKKLDTNAGGVALSHHATPQLLACLAKSLYGKTLNVYICQLKGENFEMGEELSHSSIEIVHQAVNRIVKFLKNKQKQYA